MHTLEERQKAYREEEGQELDAAAPGTRRVDLSVPIGYAFVPTVAMKAASEHNFLILDPCRFHLRKSFPGANKT